MGPNDADLIQRWQRGDLSAFEMLVCRWQQPVARFLCRLTGQTSTVPDLCQEVFLRVYRAGPRYREAGTFSTWLYQIALNVIRDAARRRRHEPAPLEDHDPADSQADANEIVLQKEAIQAVTKALAELPEALRLVLVMHHYEGLNFEQIARLTKTPASTLKSRFAVALKQLRARLQALGFGPEEMTP